VAFFVHVENTKKMIATDARITEPVIIPLI
jgi:hypothetical protein